uniref:Uncharacterized protein n=1 Tax=Mesocestoides corti TaxID=53468 RepID=A0A5K3EID7_MESCO
MGSRLQTQPQVILSAELTGKNCICARSTKAAPVLITTTALVFSTCPASRLQLPPPCGWANWLCTAEDGLAAVPLDRYVVAIIESPFEPLDACQ